MLVAAVRLNCLSWRGRRFGEIPGGKTSKDIVHDAILKTMAGDRVWNQSNSLLEHLAGVISSEISHLVSSAENRRTLRAVDEKIVMIADPHEDPETIAIRRIQDRHFLTYLEKKKPILRLLAELILYDPDGSTPELMAKLGLSFRELESLKRALRRSTEDFLNGGRDVHPRSDATNVKSAFDHEQLSSPPAE